MFNGSLLARIRTRGLRRILRGHRILKKSGCIGKVNAVNEMLTATKCTKGSYFSETIFGAAADSAELAVRQYLLVRLAGVRLGKAILYAYNKAVPRVIFPLPLEWRNAVNGHGFDVAALRSAALWRALVVVFLGYGILSIGRALLQGVKELVRPSLPPLGRYVFFDGLSKNNLPRLPQDGLSQEIISWYEQWSGRAPQVDSLCHTVRDTAQRTALGVPLFALGSAIPPLASLAMLLRYLGWGVAAIGIAIFDLLCGRWWHALMLSEASKAALVRMHQPDQLARDYLFHNSGWIYRPLWTYEAEAKGSRIIFYFYSTNCESFQRPERDPSREYYGYRAMSWPYYLVWDKYQADFVQRVACGNPNIDIAGPIWFSTGAVKVPELPRSTIAVFDVQPVRDAFYNTLAVEFDYYTPKTANQFLTDICDVLKEADCGFALKRKRDLGSLVHPGYKRFVERLDAGPHCIDVDPSTAAVNVIENSIAVISMPFTSTALLGREMRKPSIYYDPHGLLQKNDRAAHGIEILSGKEELIRWVASVLRDIRVDDSALVH